MLPVGMQMSLKRLIKLSGSQDTPNIVTMAINIRLVLRLRSRSASSLRVFLEPGLQRARSLSLRDTRTQQKAMMKNGSTNCIVAVIPPNTCQTYVREDYSRDRRVEVELGSVGTWLSTEMKFSELSEQSVQEPRGWLSVRAHLVV